MAVNETGAIWGLPPWLSIPSNKTASVVTDIVSCAVTAPFSIFSFLGNLAVIVAVIRAPSLQRPCSVLLCSLVTTDCLAGLIVQPLFIAWRLIIHRIHKSCDDQAELFTAYWTCQYALTGWSFANVVLISFDRHYALAKPLVYRANVTKKGTTV